MDVRMLALGLVVFAAGIGESSGQLLQPTSQTRTVSGSAFAEDPSGSTSDSDSDQAPDFGVLDTGVSAQAEVPGALGAGGATQNSAFLAYSIVAQGSAFANGEGYDFDGYGDGSGASRMSTTFTLTAESDYSLTGSIGAFDNGFSLVSLRNATVEIFGAFASGPAEEIPLDTAGTLPPGEYTLELEAEGNASGDLFTYSYAFAEYTATFQIAGTGPGGEVPDAKDVPGGPPLELSLLPGGDVRLVWSPSCRGDDTDYAVYEGQISNPTNLAALVCSTGGVRTYDAIPSFDGSYFVVVPTDGVTEGSYGNTSDDIERLPSLGACMPQVLGEPICP